jgi:hypothetical protein
MENESISAFAYTMGKSIEQVLNEKTNNLEEENKMLQAKILDFRNKIKNEWSDLFYTFSEDLLQDYDQHFDKKIIRRKNWKIMYPF